MFNKGFCQYGRQSDTHPYLFIFKIKTKLSQKNLYAECRQAKCLGAIVTMTKL